MNDNLKAASPRVLVAMSAFKGHLTNSEASETAANALETLGYQIRIQPVGDGGLGTAAAISKAHGGEWRDYQTVGPLGEPTTARALFFPSVSATEWIYVEAPQAIGHHLIPADRRDAMRASSRGLGIWLSQILSTHARSPLFIGLGDSATSDMGMGMLQGLGVRFLDRSGRELNGDGNALRLIENWEFTNAFPKTLPPVTVLCDVLNPLCGAKGSAKTFAPQKGAYAGQVTLLEQGMEHFAALIKANMGKDLRSLPMGGSAGGLSAAILAFLGGNLVQGSRYLLDWIGFDEMLSKTDLLLVGEGKTDEQTLSGKAPFECLKRAQAKGITSYLISGKLGEGIESLHTQMNVHLFECLDQPSAKEALRHQVTQVFKQD